MNLLKAREILEDEDGLGSWYDDDELENAIKISSEAIQRLLSARSYNQDWAILPLPHETMD